MIIKPKPTYLGDEIPVSGDGNITNDRKENQYEKYKKYLNQDINNPTYLFHRSPYKLTKIVPKLSHDSNNNLVNIAEAIFLFPSFIKATAYAFKDTIKKRVLIQIGILK